MTMKKTVLIEGIFLLVVSFVGVGESIRLISDIDPHTVYDALGPGYYILFLSLALMAAGDCPSYCSLWERCCSGKGGCGQGNENERMIYMVLAMALYLLLIDIVGYLIATPLFFLMEFRIGGNHILANKYHSHGDCIGGLLLCLCGVLLHGISDGGSSIKHGADVA